LNTQLKYLNDLVSKGVIDQQDYVNRLYLAYENDAESFNGKDTDFVEKVMKASNIPFNRDMEAAEASLGSTLNQFISGVSEGFTTLGWADDADTSTESIANKMGHLIGLAPDVIAGVLSMGASIPMSIAKASIRKAGGRTVTAKAGIKVKNKIRKVQETYQKGTSKLAERLKVGNFDLQKEVVNKVTGEKQYFLRSVPMRISDWVVGSAQTSLNKNGLLASGFLNKGLLGNERFRKIAHDGVHLGVALGVSARKEGPAGMVEAAIHGTMAGAVFGGIGEMTNIGKLLTNPKYKTMGEKALRKLVYRPDEVEAGVNLFARGVLGSAYTGGMATAQDLPLPEQIYEYSLGFFFGASGRSLAEVKATEYLTKNPLPGGANLVKAKEVMKKTEEFKKLPEESKEYIDRHFNLLNMQQADKLRGAYDLMGIKYTEKAVKKDVDLKNITDEEHRAISEELVEESKFEFLDKDKVDLTINEAKIRLRAETESIERIGKPEQGKEDKAPKTKKESVEQLELFEEIKQELKEETERPFLSNFDEVISEIRNADLNEHIIKDTPTKSLYKEIKKKHPELDFEDLGLVLSNSIIENINSFETFAKTIERAYPKVKLDVGTLKKFFLKKSTYRLQNDWMISIDDTLLPIGKRATGEGKGEGVETDRHGNVIIVKGAQDKLNKMYGDNRVRKVLRYTEKEIPAETDIFGNIIKPRDIELIPPLDKGWEYISNFSKELLKNKQQYVHSANKDSGTVVIQQVPFSLTFPVGKFNKLVLKEIKRVAPSEKSIIDKDSSIEFASNVAYELIDNGLIKQNELTDMVKVQKALRTYLAKDGGYAKNAGKINKYQPLTTGIDIPIPKDGLIDIIPEGYMNVTVIGDGSISAKGKGGENSGRDGVFRIRQDIYDRIAEIFGIEEFIKFMKPVGFVIPRDGKGNLKIKAGLFRADNNLNKEMMEKNTHLILNESGLKTQGGVKFSELSYNVKDGKYSLKGDVVSFKMKPEELGINLDVTEKSTTRNLKLYKQFSDKNTSLEIDSDTGKPIFDKEYFKEIQALRDVSIDGDPVLNEYFTKGLENQKTFSDYIKEKDVDIDLLNLNLVLKEIEKNIDKPTGKWSIEKIFERYLEDSVLPESFNYSDYAELEATNLYILEAKRSGYSHSSLLSQGNKEYFHKVLGNYVANRVQRVTVKNGFNAVAYPLTEQIVAEGGIDTNKYRRGDGAKEDPIFIDFTTGEADLYSNYINTTLGEAYKTFKEDLTPGTVEHQAYKEALTFLNMRSPSGSNGAVRAQLFDGFVKDGGSRGYYSNEYNDLMQGGMDKDGDKVIGYQSLSNIIKKAFGNKYIQREFETNLDGKVIDIKDTDGSLKIAKEIFGAKLAEDSLVRMFSQEERLKIGDAARAGKKGMGQIINGMTQMQLLMQMTKENGGSLDVGAGKRIELINDDFESLKRISIVGSNIHADSARYSELNSPSKSLSTTFNKFFKYYNPDASNSVKRGDGSLDIGKIVAFENKDGSTGSFPLTYYSIFNTKFGAPGTQAFRAFSRMLNDKANVATMKQLSLNFLEYFDINSEGSSTSNYYINLARTFNRLESLDVGDFSYTKYTKVQNLISLVEKVQLSVKDSSIVQDLGLVDYYSIRLTQKERDVLQQNPIMLEQRVNETLGIGLLVKSGEDIMTLLQQVPGMNGRKAKNLLKEIINSTYELKQRNRKSYLDSINLDKKVTTDKTNPLNIFKFITKQKEGIVKYIESFTKDKKVKEIFKEQLEEFYDWSILANPVPTEVEKSLSDSIKIGRRTGGQQVQNTLQESIVRLSEVTNEIRLKTKRQGDSPEVDKLYSIRAGILNSVQGRAKNYFQNPAIRSSSIRKFHHQIDSLMREANKKLDLKQPEPKKVEIKTPELKQADTKTPTPKVKKEIIKASPEEGIDTQPILAPKDKEIIKDIEREYEETPKLSKEIEFSRQKYSKIESINIEEALEKRANDPNITDGTILTLLEFNETIKRLPNINEYVEPLFEQWSRTAIGRDLQGEIAPFGKPFSEITVPELARFTRYLDAVTTPGWLKSFWYDPKVQRSPEGRDHILTQQYTEEYLSGATKDASKIFRTVDNIIEDKNGNITFKAGKVPTTALAYGTEIQIKFHDIDNTFRRWVKDTLIGETVDFATLDKGNIMGSNFDVLFTMMKRTREYGPDKDGNGTSEIYLRETDEGKANFKKKYFEAKEIIDELIVSGEKFRIKDSEGESGLTKEVSAQDIIDIMQEGYTEIQTKVYKDVIESKYPMIRRKVMDAGMKVDEYKIPKSKELDFQTMEKNADNVITHEIQQLQKTLLDKNGMQTNVDKIRVLYKGMLERGTGDVDTIVRETFSEADARFIEHNMLVMDILKEHFPKQSFKKELTEAEMNRTRSTSRGQTSIKEVMDLIWKSYSVDTRIRQGRFVNWETGKVDQYVEHVGGMDFESLRVENKVAIEKRIQTRLKEMNPDGVLDVKKLPANIRLEYEAGLLSKDLALKLAEIKLRDVIDKQNATGVDLELAMGEESSLRLLSSRPELYADMSNRNLRSRSEESLPGYDTSINATERYVQSMYSSWLRHVQNIKLKMITDQFIEADPFGTDKTSKDIAYNWKLYMQDVFSNNNGFPSLRNFTTHGIRKTEASLLKSYVDNNLDRDKLKKKQHVSPADVRFLDSIDATYAITTLQRARIRSIKDESGFAKADAILSQRIENIKEIINPENVNRIGRFGTYYQLLTDESVVNGIQKVDDFFGGSILKNAPKGGEARKYYLTRKAKQWSQLEGKFEMVSLLSHPKSAITNFYGGFSNTIVDEGWSAFRKANDEAWLLTNIFPKGKDKRGPSYFTVNSKGQKQKNYIESYNDIINWLFRQGFMEDGLSTEGYYSQQKSKVDRGRIKDLIVRKILGEKDASGNNYISMSKKDAAALRSRTLKEASEELGVVDGITDIGSYFMKQSEMILRTRTALASIINSKEVIGRDLTVDMKFDDPIILNLARKSIKASQFVYHATQRPNFSNTNLGRIMTRFQPYAWNSIGRRIDIYKGAKQEQWAGGLSTKRAQGQFTADVFALAMANIFAASIFEYALSPPMSWMQDTAELIFGDEKMRDRAFFSQYPHPVLAPLSIATPPISRFVLAPLTAIINNDYERLWNYQFATYLPFGRLGKDFVRSIKSPAMAPDFLTGLPLHKIHAYSRDYFSSQTLDEILAELREENNK
tara:strand:- start:3640 stop:13197 length:9558 start_codon:yes stop_codon:yes gene_type:complete